MLTLTSRPATSEDTPAIAAIYSEGIEDRVATFETRPRTADDVRDWLNGRHPVVVVTDDSGRVIAFGATFPYRPRDCYAGIAETSVYVTRSARGYGAGRVALQAVIDAARNAGFWKLLSRIFPENHASRALVRSVGFREVGIYERHGRLDGKWRDVVIVEYVIRENL
jgi:L-amino acid N-acyltransferase YncA